MFGCGALAQHVLSGGSHGLFLTVNFAFGFAATLGILVCGQVSGRKTDSSVKDRDDKFPLTWFDMLRSEFFKQTTEKSGGQGLHCIHIWRQCFHCLPIVFMSFLFFCYHQSSCLCCTGGHLNPAVTFSLCLLGRERWRKFPLYFLFQTIGAFFGAAVIFGMYYGKRWLWALRQKGFYPI